MQRNIHVTMPDGSVWAVPVSVVEKDSASYYGEIGDDDPGVQGPMADDEVLEWAAGNMDWSDVKEHARLVRPADPLTDQKLQEGWVHGEKRIVRS